MHSLAFQVTQQTKFADFAEHHDKDDKVKRYRLERNTVSMK